MSANVRALFRPEAIRLRLTADLLPISRPAGGEPPRSPPTFLTGVAVAARTTAAICSTAALPSPRTPTMSGTTRRQQIEAMLAESPDDAELRYFLAMEH